MNCHACGAPLAATARFCHKCGAQVGGAQSSVWRAGLPWSVAGGALGALLTVLALRIGASSGGGVGGGGGGGGGAPSPTPHPPPAIFLTFPGRGASPPSKPVLLLDTHREEG